MDKVANFKLSFLHQGSITNNITVPFVSYFSILPKSAKFFLRGISIVETITAIYKYSRQHQSHDSNWKAEVPR